MNWNPVASADDFSARENPEYLVYALEQRLGVKSQTLAADIQQELDKLLWADLLILNFPIYWFSAPAMLKGWIDRVGLRHLLRRQAFLRPGRSARQESASLGNPGRT
ncbi:hypothetical protein D3C85_1333580 [compost metagenome]